MRPLRKSEAKAARFACLDWVPVGARVHGRSSDHGTLPRWKCWKAKWSPTEKEHNKQVIKLIKDFGKDLKIMSKLKIVKLNKHGAARYIMVYPMQAV